jgi:DnaJ-class molecular chaperone
MDYYKILELERNCDQNDIKKAYKKNALKYHPDKNLGNVEVIEKFNKIKEAYDILSDERKRKIYDKHGINGLKHFEENIQQQQMEKKKTVKYINYSIKELYNKVSKNLTLNIKKQCMECLGSGAKKKLLCDNCNGDGVKVVIHRIGPFMQQMQQKCINCRGYGYKIIEKCKTCEGKCFIKEIKNIEFKIEGDNYDNIFKVYKDEGDEDNDGIKSDLVIIMKEIMDERYKRRGYNIHIKEDIYLYDSLVGLKKEIDYIDNSNLIIKSDKIIKDNDVKIIKNYGMKKQNGENGDLIIEFNIIYPNSLLNESLLNESLLKKLNMKSENISNIKNNMIELEDYESKIEKINNDFFENNQDQNQNIFNNFHQNVHHVQECNQS